MARLATASATLALIGLLLASILSAYCQTVKVALSAEPQECVLELIGGANTRSGARSRLR